MDNRKTTITDLPEEIMSAIFSRVVDLVGPGEFGRNVVPVCRAFRNLALGDRRLWTDLRGDDDVAVSTASGTLGFVRRLTVDCRSLHLWSPQFLGSLPALEELKIANSEECGEEDDNSEVFDKLVYTRLKTLDLRDLLVENDLFASFTRSSCCDNLTHLRLTNLGFLSTAAGFHMRPISAVLTPVIERLETLELCGLRTFSRADEEQWGPSLDLNAVLGGRLKSLTLRDIHVSFEGVKNQSRPNLTVLVLDRVSNGYYRFMSYACLYRLLEGCQCLTDLVLNRTLEVCHSSLSELVCQKCPRLERLEVTGREWPLPYPLFDVGQVLTGCKNIRQIHLNRVLIYVSEDGTRTSSRLTHLRIERSFENEVLNRSDGDRDEYHRVLRSSWMRALLSRCSNLRVLDLSGLCMYLQDEDTWTSVIADTCCRRLTTLRLRDIGDRNDYRLTRFDLNELLRRLTRLNRLSLDFVAIEYRSGCAGAESTSLRHLELLDIEPFTLGSAVLPLLETYGSQLESLKFKPLEDEVSLRERIKKSVSTADITM